MSLWSQVRCPSLSLLPGTLGLEIVVTIKVEFTGQIDMFEKYSV